MSSPSSSEDNKKKLIAGGVFALVLFLIFMAPSQGRGAGSLTTWLRTSPSACRPLEDIIRETYADEQQAPQLQPDQVRWIATELDPWSKAVPPHFLVLGLGMDSIMWQNINCAGRSVFLEGMKSWIEKVQQMDPRLEIYEVAYNTTVGTASEFFTLGPWSLDVPQSVRSDCFDVILVDAPQGYRPHTPGRFQSTQLAVEMAHRCVSTGRKRKVTIFLHDAQRQGEQTIVERQLLAQRQVYFLGNMVGKHGHLYGFEYSANFRTDPRF